MRFVPRPVTLKLKQDLDPAGEARARSSHAPKCQFVAGQGEAINAVPRPRPAFGPTTRFGNGASVRSSGIPAFRTPKTNAVRH
jgi:hypothetical protein